MLTQRYRVRSRQDFIRCYTQGEKYITRNYILFVYKTSLSVWRLGITATKKNGNAVLRNKFKRVIRAFFSKYKMQLADGYDFILVSRYPLDKKKLVVHAIEKELLPPLQLKYTIKNHG